MKKNIVIVLAILFIISAVVFVVFTGGDNTNQEEYNFKNYESIENTRSEFSGKPLVLNSWAVWCPFCVEELKVFAEVQEEAGDKVQIIAINRKESPSKIKKFTDKLGVTDSLVFMLDSSDSFYREIGGFSMPETVFIDGNGNTVFHKRGPMTANELKSKLSSELGITI